MHAHKVSTATLNICGALDRCTPSEEARQFHSALVENGVESILVTYPEEGHGVRKLPASVDYAARLVSWIRSPPAARPAPTPAGDPAARGH
jgi:dipeptidyl aminopeptidase/acylaminoacyl peptidase